MTGRSGVVLICGENLSSSAELPAQQLVLFGLDHLRFNSPATLILMGFFLLQQKAMPASGKANPVQSGERKIKRKLQNMASFLGWNQPRWILLFPLPAGGVSQSWCVFSAPCHHHGDRTGTRVPRQRSQSDTSQLQRAVPSTSNFKDKYSFCCSLKTSAFFSPPPPQKSAPCFLSNPSW